MKKFLCILIFGSISLLYSCGKPTVVNVVQPGDKDLDCKQLEEELAESQKIKRDAEYAKTGTGGNVARMMIFWPAWAQTLSNADKAITAANDRNFHLVKIMRKKNCKGVEKASTEVTATGIPKNSIAGQLQAIEEMYKSGTLTKEEFEEAKKKTLNQ